VSDSRQLRHDSIELNELSLLFCLFSVFILSFFLGGEWGYAASQEGDTVTTRFSEIKNLTKKTI